MDWFVLPSSGIFRIDGGKACALLGAGGDALVDKRLQAAGFLAGVVQNPGSNIPDGDA